MQTPHSRDADESLVDERALREALDTTYEVVAPENVAFQYRAAGPFIRAFAYALDVFVIFLTFVLFSMLLGEILRFFGARSNRELASSLFAFFFILGALFAFWFWNAFFEAFWGGRTPGKAIMGLRTTTTAGRPISFPQALLRNVLRSADLALGPFCVVVMGANDRMARLGDLAAGTIVVNERLQRRHTQRAIFHEQLIVNIASNIPDEFSASETTMKALALYVSRRLALSPPRRYEIAAPLASTLARRARFPYRVDPDAFLCALYQKLMGNVAAR